MNSTILIGYATRNADLTETSNGIKIAKFNIAVKRNYEGANGERKTDFFPVVAFRIETVLLQRGALETMCILRYASSLITLMPKINHK